MRYKNKLVVIEEILTGLGLALSQCRKEKNDNLRKHHSEVENQGKHLSVLDGKQIFRFDNFGDGDFWSGLLHLDKAVAGAANGGFGAGVSPKTALAVGLKVDAEALPADLVSGIQAGTVDLNDPATTLALIKMDAVVGIKGDYDGTGTLKSIGITWCFLSFDGG